MTAASGLVHEEMHGRDFTKRGGTLEMVQLWVNLPAKAKKESPHYQSITTAQIPVVVVARRSGLARVIAGSSTASRGPATTYTPMNVWDLRITPATGRIAVPEGHNTLLFVLSGRSSWPTAKPSRRRPGDLRPEARRSPSRRPRTRSS